jgi:uncharacterized membrane protein YccF (DUF307 family)
LVQQDLTLLAWLDIAGVWLPQSHLLEAGGSARGAKNDILVQQDLTLLAWLDIAWLDIAGVWLPQSHLPQAA